LIRLVLLLILFCSVQPLVAQKSDVVIIKNKKGNTVKVYGEGSFIRGVTKYGHSVNGFISHIENDTLAILHGETALFKTEMGTVIDTIHRTMKFHYLDFQKLDLDANTQFGGKNKFVDVYLDKILAIGSLGFIALETVNGLRSSEKFSSNNRWRSIGIAAGVYVVSRGIKKIRTSRDNVKKSYYFMYIKADEIKDLIKSDKDI
jgi:hypothetical protein